MLARLAALRHTALAANLITTSVEAAGTDWRLRFMKTNGTGTLVAPAAGNTYTCVSNGTSYGNSVNNTRIRKAEVAGVQTFPGDSFAINTNCELRAKGGTVGQANVTLNLHGEDT